MSLEDERREALEDLDPGYRGPRFPPTPWYKEPVVVIFAFAALLGTLGYIMTKD